MVAESKLTPEEVQAKVDAKKAKADAKKAAIAEKLAQEEADAAAALIDSLEKRLVDQDTLLRRVEWELVRAARQKEQAVERADSLERKLESQDIMMRSFVTRAGDLVESHHCVKCQIRSQSVSPIEIERRALLRRVLGE